MNKKLKADWIKALRSGEYEQGMGGLCEVHADHCTYCCLGVLYDVGVDGYWILSLGGGFWKTEKLNGGDLGEYLGPIGLDPKDHRTLIDMNDSGLPFDEIAEYIEKYL